MSKGLKIFAGILVFLGVLSLIFLLTAKNRAQTAASSKTVSVKKVTAQDTTQAKLQANIRSQWQKCKAKTMAAGTTLLWNVQISEAIPQGGGYAKGALDNDPSFLVHVTIKAGAQFTDKIKALLVVGKMANLRGTCTDVASDGSVVLEAF
jgi:hypothetical protein